MPTKDVTIDLTWNREAYPGNLRVLDEQGHEFSNIHRIALTFDRDHCLAHVYVGVDYVGAHPLKLTNGAHLRVKIGGGEWVHGVAHEWHEDEELPPVLDEATDTLVMRAYLDPALTGGVDLVQKTWNSGGYHERRQPYIPMMEGMGVQP